MCYFIQVELKKLRTDRSRKNPTIFERKSLLVPPMSQTCILNPSFWTDLILNPCKRTSSALAYWYRPFFKTAMQSNTWVGVMCWMSSLAMNFKIVVFPAWEAINTHYFIKWWVMLKLPFVFFPFVQFATNIKMVCDNWNISTALWLRRLENFNSFLSGKSPLYSILGNILVLFQNCIWTMFSPQDPSGVYYVICLAWILSGILYDVFVACTIHRGGKNGKYILACEQALHLGESQEFTREPHSKETRMWLRRSPARSLVVCLQSSR